MSRFKTVGAPFKTRRSARKKQREVQHALTLRIDEGRPLPAVDPYIFIPDWARGVHVEKAGFFQYVLVATEKRGH